MNTEKQKCVQQSSKYTQQYQLSTSKLLGSSQGTSGGSVDLNDLIHLDGPITEDSLIRALQSRFMANECFVSWLVGNIVRSTDFAWQTNIGPVLISINAFNDKSNALTLNSTQHHTHCCPLLRVVHEAVRQQTETGYPQAIILRYVSTRLSCRLTRQAFYSGSNGSGKTYSSMLILRQLFNVVGGGPETDAFKHLAAAFTVLRSLGSAKTINNCESSRIVCYRLPLSPSVICRSFIAG